MPKKPVVTTNNGLFLVLVVTVQSQQNLRFSVCLCRLVVVLRPGRPEVRILPVAPRAAPYGVLLFLFCADFMGRYKRRDSNSPCPAAWRIPSGVLKKRIAMYFCNALFVLMLFGFSIISVTYHLRHRCTALLPVFYFSADLWWFS